jgi:O-antigen/teichoic acid export membrane protein
MMLPLQLVTRLVSRAIIPVLARQQHDRDAMRRLILDGQRSIAFVTTPLTAGLLVLAAPVVRAVFGEAWAGMIPILRLLCLVALVQSTSATIGWIFQSTGRTDLHFRWEIVTGIATIAAFAVGVRWGAVGVAAAYVVVNYLFWLPTMRLAGRLVNLPFREYLRNQLDIAGMAALMAIALAWLEWTLPATWTAWSRLALQIPLGVLIYCGLAAVLRPKTLRAALVLARPARPDVGAMQHGHAR